MRGSVGARQTWVPLGARQFFAWVLSGPALSEFLPRRIGVGCDAATQGFCVGVCATAGLL